MTQEELLLQQQQMQGQVQVPPQMQPQVVPQMAPQEAPVAPAPVQFNTDMGKFTKANAFTLLMGIANGLTEVQFADDISRVAFLQLIKHNFEPQAGGGKSNNPSHIDPATGLMVHWCRFLHKYMPESEMVVSQGKTKGASKLASKYNYLLGKKVKELKDKSLELFALQKYPEGAAMNAQAEEVEKSRTRPETYTPEALASVDETVKKQAETPTVVSPMEAQPTVPTSVPPLINQVPVQQPMQPPMVDANGNQIVYQ